MIESLLEQISINKISSVEVADALKKTGVLNGVHPINHGKYVVGQVYYVCTWLESNWPLHDQIQEVPSGSVVFVDVYECNDRAVLGDIVCKQLFTYQRVQGLVVNGYVRDAHRLIKEDYPIWSKGVTPLGCFNTSKEPNKEVKKFMLERKRIFDQALLVADDSGCTLIQKENQDALLLNSLQHIELQEDIWYYCLDTLKMNSYQIICLKKYIEDTSLLPPVLLDRLQNLHSSGIHEKSF